MPAPAASAWWIVVPIKGTDLGKSRLSVEWPGDIRTLARAFALDVIAAVSSAHRVAGVVVVTTRQESELLSVERRAAGEGAHESAAVEFVEDPGSGLNAAIRTGVGRVRHAGALPVAALLGDLPALTPDEVDRALRRAEDAPASFLPDATGAGTTLVTAGRGVPFRSAFGADSAARHRSIGLAELNLDLPGIRRDVDTYADLVALPRTGPHTTQLLIGHTAVRSSPVES